MSSDVKVKKAWYKKWWVWVIVAVVIIGIGANGAADDDTTTQNNESATNTLAKPAEKEWKVVATLEGTDNNKKTDTFTLAEGDVRIRYEVEGKTGTTASLIYLLKEGTTKSQNERGEIELASAVDTVIGTDKGQKIIKEHAGDYYLEMNSSDVFKYKIYIEQ